MRSSLSFRESEAFLFHTRLAHVSSALRERDPVRALDRLALMAQGVGGGTKIGECLAAFNRWHARRVHSFAHLRDDLSDGYDTGEPAAARSGDAGASPPLPAHRLAQSADRLGRLRAERARACRRRCRLSISSRRRITSTASRRSNLIWRGFDMSARHSRTGGASARPTAKPSRSRRSCARFRSPPPRRAPRR